MIPTAEIETEVRRLAERLPVVQEMIETVDTARVGRSLGSLGFEKSASNGQKRSWVISQGQIDSIAKARNIALEPDGLPF